MEFGEKLRFLRLVQGLSQKELASMAGTSSPYLARYEASVNRPKRATTLLLAQSLRVRVEWLDYGVGAPFLLRVWVPVREEDTKKHRETVIRGVETLFPEFLSSNNVLHVVRYAGGNNDVHYLIAFKAMDSTGKCANDISVVIIFVDDGLDLIVGKHLTECKITVNDCDITSVNVNSDIDSSDLFEFYIGNLSAEIAGVEPFKYISDYVENEKNKESRQLWTIPVSFVIESDAEITQKEAEKLIYEAAESLNFNTNLGVKLKFEIK